MRWQLRHPAKTDMPSSPPVGVARYPSSSTISSTMRVSACPCTCTLHNQYWTSAWVRLQLATPPAWGAGGMHGGVEGSSSVRHPQPCLT